LVLGWFNIAGLTIDFLKEFDLCDIFCVFFFWTTFIEYG